MYIAQLNISILQKYTNVDFSIAFFSFFLSSYTS